MNAAYRDLMIGCREASKALVYASKSAPRWQGRPNSVNFRRRVHRETPISVQRLCFALNFRTPPNCRTLGPYNSEGQCREDFCLKGMNNCPINRDIRRRFNQAVVRAGPDALNLVNDDRSVAVVSREYGFGRERGINFESYYEVIKFLLS